MTGHTLQKTAPFISLASGLLSSSQGAFRTKPSTGPCEPEDRFISAFFWLK